MEIILVRHGKPDLPALGWISACDLPKIVALYDSVGLAKEPKPPQATRQIISRCGAVVCSDLSRSIESARLLGLEAVDWVDESLREFQLPYANWPLLRLSPYTWAFVFRLLWLMGFSRNGESREVAKARAKEGANRLIEIAQERDSVVFVGHGLINHYLGKELRARGWEGPRLPNGRYWGYCIYRR